MSHYTVYNGEQIGASSRAPYIGAKPTYDGCEQPGSYCSDCFMELSFESSYSLTDMFVHILQPAFDLKSLIIRWVSGHGNIAGNEFVDVETRRAAAGNSSRAALLPSVMAWPARHILRARNESQFPKPLSLPRKEEEYA